MRELCFTVAACGALTGPAVAADVSSLVCKNAPAGMSVVPWNYSNYWTPNATGFPASCIDLISIGSGAFNSQAVTAGGQAGCYGHIGECAVGVERDFGYDAANARRQLASPGLNAPSFSVTEGARSSRLGAVRGRFGVANSACLFYLTGGEALANPQFSFAPHWSVKAEYRSVDLGSASYTGSAGRLAITLHNHTVAESIGHLAIKWQFLTGPSKTNG